MQGEIVWGRPRRRVRRVGPILTALMVVALAAAAAPAAHGASIAYDLAEGSVAYEGSAGEVNNVVVSESAGQVVFTDAAGITITDGDGIDGPCAIDLVSPNIARCPQAGTTALRLNTGDGDDIVHVNVAIASRIDGGDGFDRLFGGPADDQLLGGPGADLINGVNGNDVMDTGVGGLDPNNPLCLNELEELVIPLCQDFAGGGQGKDTISYASRAFNVLVDTRFWVTPFGNGSIAVDDPDPTCMTTQNVATVRPDCQIDNFSGADQTGTEFIERIVGGEGDDDLVGDKFDNTLIGGPGADTLCGGQGVDTVDYSDRDEDVTVTLNGKIPTDPDSALGGIAGQEARIDCRTALKIGQGSVPLPPGPNAPRDCLEDDGAAGESDCVGEDVENVLGGAGDDTITGGDPDKDINEGPNLEPKGINRLDGGPGNDVLNGRFGPDVLTGGDGVDTVTYADRAEGVTASIDGDGRDGSATAPLLNKEGGTTGDFNPYMGQWDEIGTDVEDLIGGQGDDTLVGDDGANDLVGGPGDDDVSANAGSDTLDAGAGDDALIGGEDADTLLADEGADQLDGGGGADVLSGSAGNDFLRGGTGADDIEGGDGEDAVDWTGATSAVTLSLNGVADDGTAGEQDDVASDVESANGGLGDDTLVVGDGDGAIDGGPGNDRLDGGAGADSLFGGPGLDTADYSSRVNALGVDVNAGGGDGETGEGDDVQPDVETILGGAGGDVLVGGASASILMGNGGADQLIGVGGDDQLFGGPGADMLDGGDANDTLDGGDDSDALGGQNGNDTLSGGNGDDALDGGPGRDSLAGNAGADRALYNTRTTPVTLSFDGNSNDGESGEGDLIKLDVEATTAGSGADLVASRNGIRNSISCGPGSDQISADTFDDIGPDCERIINVNPCKPSTAPVAMSGSGVVTITVSCTDDASGSLLLQTYKPLKQLDKARKKARGSAKLKAKRVTLGKGSFKLKRGQNKKVKVRLKGSARQLVRRSKKGLDARAVLTVRQSFGVRALSLENGRKLKIKAKR